MPVRLLAVTCLALSLLGPPSRVAADPPPAPLQIAVAPVDGAVVAPFAPPEHRYGSGHRGVDLHAQPGDPVRAAMAGVVRFAGEVAGVGWVSVDHGGGLDTTYGPIEPRRVSAGDRVDAGDLLGFVAADAAHVDWGARLDGQYIDPLSLLVRWEVHLTHPDAPVPLLARVVAAVGGAVAGGRLLRPVAGPLTSGFGSRRHPITGETRLHAGLDIAAPAGTPVAAPAAGTVVTAGWAGGYGLLVAIDHGDGLQTRMAHLSRVDVAVGQRVAAGEQVGAVGSTGLSTGPHLHFEVRVGGVAQDPAPWLSAPGG